MNKPIVVRGNFNQRTGFGQLASAIAVALPTCGFTVKCIPLTVDEQNVSDEVKELIIPEARNPRGIDLLIHQLNWGVEDPPTFLDFRSETSLMFTMWESSRIRMPWARFINQHSGVIVPNKWNASNFHNDGVEVPIHTIPLFVDPIFRSVAPIEPTDTFTFGCAANIQEGLGRKKLDEVARLFVRAFPNDQNVRLKIKTSGGQFPRFTDDRIQQTVSFLPTEKLVEWFQSIDVFVSLSPAEGWGLMQHQAMACAKPLIAIQYGGLAEFFDESVGFPVHFVENWAQGFYRSSGGLWADYDEDDVIEKMRFSYKNRDITAEKGLLSEKRAHEFTIENTMGKLAEVLWPFMIESSENV